MIFRLRLSIGAAFVVLTALGAGAAPDVENPDEPPNSDVVKLLNDPRATGTGAAFSAARAVALARGDARKWYQLLRREALSGIDSRASDRAAASEARESLIRRIEADRPRRASLEVDIAFSLVIAELQRPARDSYASVYALRDRLGDKPREALPFVCTPQSGDWHPTSRDVVSYLYAKLLADGPRPSLRGTAELQRLLGPLPEGPDGEESAAGKACAVLDDLERWHLSVTSRLLNHRTGALQARIERLRILSLWFPSRADQAHLIANLRGLLPAYRDDAVWAEGMAQLALFVNQSAERPEDPLVIADEGARAYPGSPGGERCSAIARALRLEIQDPGLELSPERGGQPLGSALSVSHGRAASLRFRAFPEPVDLECVARAEEPQRAEPKEGAVEWTAKLPEPAPGERSTTSIPLPLPRKGLYRLQFGLDASPLPKPAHSILVTDMALLSRRRDREVEVWAVEAPTGAPIRNAEVRLILHGGAPEPGSTTVSSRSTDADGRAVLELPEGRVHEGQLVIVARRGEDSASSYVGPHEERTARDAPVASAASTDSKTPLLDLSLDRPNGAAGETVRWKAGLYCAGSRASEGLFPPLSGAKLTLSLRDAANGTVEPLSTVEVSTGPFGDASGEIVLPRLAQESEKGWILELTTRALCGESGAAAGIARTSVKVPRRSMAAGIEVALTQPALVSGVPARLEGVASRGGVPLAGAHVAWEISAPRAVIRQEQSREGSRGDRTPWERVTDGDLSTDSQGRFSIPVIGPASPGGRAGFESLFFRLDLRSVDGDRAIVRRNLTALAATVALSVSGPTVYRKGERIEMRISRRGAFSGAPSPGESIAKVQRIPTFEATWISGRFGSWSYGGGSLSTERALEESASAVDVREQRVICDATGEAHLSMRLDPGFYRLVVSTADEAGRKAQASRAFVVDGPSLRVPVPLALLLDERKSGPRRIFAKGSGAHVVVEISRVGAPVERRTVAANGDGVIEVRVPGNETVNVMAYAVRDGRLLGYDRALERRDDRLVLSLDAASPSLEVRATARDGTPLPGAALHVVAVPMGSELSIRDPFLRDATRPAPSRRPQLSTLAQHRPVSVPSATSSEWFRAEVPEAPSEPNPLDSDPSSLSCRLGSMPTRTRLPHQDPAGFISDSRSGFVAADARRDAPAAVWAPGLVTDARGVVRTPFHAEPGTSYWIKATAVARDGRTGHLWLLLLPEGSAGEAP